MVYFQSRNTQKSVSELVLLHLSNDLPRSLHFDVTLLPKTLPCFHTVIYDVNVSSSKLNNNVVKIQDWAYKQIYFKPTRIKKLKKLYFPEKKFLIEISILIISQLKKQQLTNT